MKLIAAVSALVVAVIGLLTSPIWGPGICRGVGFCHDTPGPTATGQTQTASVEVLGDRAWTDTGLRVTSGSSVTVVASGSIKYYGSNSIYSATPDGAGSCTATAPEGYVAPGLVCVSLIGRIADTQPFNVGVKRTFSAHDAGELFLGVNDKNGLFNDNSGSWHAIITITGAS
jgi:hypothetical protein